MRCPRLLPPHPISPLLVSLSLLLVGCRSTEADSKEESVRPGANETFLAEDLDVQRCIEVFEGESREVAALRREITATLDLRRGMGVADVGAGTGLFMDDFAAGVEELGTVYAVELSSGFVEHLERRARTSDLDQVQVVACTERSVELPAGAADVVFVCDTYHHFEYPASVLASIRKALRPGGRLVIVDFERIPALSPAWILGHVRASKERVLAEVEAAGFVYEDEVAIAGMRQNYLLRFRR